MKNIFKTLSIITLFSVSIYANNLPIIGGSITKTTINAGTGNNSFLVPVSDGDLVINQNVTVTAISSNGSVLQIVNVDYNSDNTFASVNVFAGTVAGIVTVTISAIDADGTTNKNFVVSVGDFWQKGSRLKVYDIVFWTHIVPSNRTSPKMDTVITSTAIPQNDPFYTPAKLTVGCPDLTSQWNSDCKVNGMTTGISGYIVPTVSGTYSFKFHTQDGGKFFLSTVNGGNLYDNFNMQERLRTSDSVFTINLQAGNYYPFRTTNWIVFTKNFNLSWTGPGINTFTTITSPYIYPDYDRILPTTPTALSKVNKGVNFITLRWKGSTDNDKISGYNVYSNGVKIANLQDSIYIVNALTANTLYSFAVTAVDRVGNESPISNIITSTTYPTDLINPLPPPFINSISIGDMSAEISWSGATDIGSEVVGYNVYLNGSLYTTKGYITDSTIVLKVLVPNTNNVITIEALDGAFNKSVKSSSYTIHTLKFDPLIKSIGVKKAKLNFYPTRIARNPGFGINADYENVSGYTGIFGQLQYDLQPGLIRWGGLDANPMSFRDFSGPGKPVTIAKFINFSTYNGAYSQVTCGVQNTTDWMTDINTFTKFMEYIGDPTGQTPGGALRIAEGNEYIEPLLTNSKGIIIELGNEVWGASFHNAEIGANYTTYAQWCRSVAGVIRSSPYYDSTKIFLSYSGRNPESSDSYGLHSQLFNGDVHKVDWLSLSGYLGGNLDYDPAIPAGDSELDYYKNGTQALLNYTQGLRDIMDEDINQTGRYRPFYFYEANMTTPDYNGRLGQAVTMCDYFLTASKSGLAFGAIASLASGQWSITDGTNGNAKLPFFNIAELLNRNSKGNVMKSDVVSLELLRNSTGLTLAGDPVGIHIINDGSKYSIAMFSREFDSDYQVQLNFPKNGIYSQTATKYVISGSDFNTKSAIVSNTTVPLKDSMIVTIPKYSMVLYVFDGPDLGLPLLPLGYTKYRKIDLIKIIATSPNSDIDVQYGSATFTVPAVSFAVIDKRIGWDIQIPEGVNIAFDSTGGSAIKILSNGTCEGNGVVTITAYSMEDPAVKDQIMVTVSGQVTEGLDSCATGLKDNSISSKVNIYPNPTDGVLNVVTNSENLNKIRIYDLNGLLVFESMLQSGSNSQQVQIKNLAQGLYFISIENKKGEVFRRKLIKK